MQIGVYEHNQLIKEYIFKDKTSEALPNVFKEILADFICKRIFYARGPGSFMAIKITYIFLRTLNITKNIQLFATDGFYFNNNKPIKAIRNTYFVKKDTKIRTQLFDEEQVYKFVMPKKLEPDHFTKDIEPLYILPAV